MAEQGFAEAQVTPWFGVVVPAGTPQPIVERISKALEAALATPDVQQKLDVAGCEAKSAPLGRSPTSSRPTSRCGPRSSRRPASPRTEPPALIVQRIARVPMIGGPGRRGGPKTPKTTARWPSESGNFAGFSIIFSMFPMARNTSYITPVWSPASTNMTSESPPNSPTTRSFSLSIGQLTFGSFLLVLAVIIITRTASVIAIRHIDSTFAELQRLQSVGDLAEDIDRRMNELRLAARDFVTDPGTQSGQVGEAATSLSEVLKKTRLELAPEQQDMIDGVTERLSTYRSGIERISALINRRAEMIVALPPLREKFDAAIAESADPAVASTLSADPEPDRLGVAGAQSRRLPNRRRRACGR